MSQKDISSRPTEPVIPKQNSILVTVMFVLLVSGLAAIIAGYTFAERPVTVPSDNRLYELMTGKEHQRLVQQLDKNRKAVLVGNRKDGLYLFADYYLSQKIKEGYLIKKRQFTAGESIKYQRFPLLSVGYNWLHGQFFSKEQLPTLWFIETRSVLDIHELGQLASFAEAHPNHRFIVAANETKHGNDHGFKKITFQRPSDTTLVKILNDHKLSKVIARNIVRYHNSSFPFLSDLINMPNIQNTFNSYFSQETVHIQNLIANSSKASKVLKALCENGKFATKKQIEDILPYNGVIAYENGAYYWTTIKNVYAYSNSNGQECTLKVKFVEAPLNPELVEEELVVETTVEQPKIVDESPKKTDKTKAGKKKGK